MLFHQREEYDCPLPPQCTDCLWTERDIRQLRQCRPNTTLLLGTDEAPVLQLTENPLPNSAAQRGNPTLLNFPALHPLKLFSSVTGIFSGMKVQCWWHKHRCNKRMEGCCWHLTNSARIGNSSLHKFPCAEAVNANKLSYMVCWDPVKQFWCKMTCISALFWGPTIIMCTLLAV